MIGKFRSEWCYNGRIVGVKNLSFLKSHPLTEYLNTVKIYTQLETRKSLLFQNPHFFRKINGRVFYIHDLRINIDIIYHAVTVLQLLTHNLAFDKNPAIPTRPGKSRASKIFCKKKHKTVIKC